MLAEQKLFGIIASRVTNPTLKESIQTIKETGSGTVLANEISVLTRSALRVNNLLNRPTDPDLLGIEQCKRIMGRNGHFPIILSDEFPNWTYALKKVLKISQTEVANIYKDPKEINNADALSVFRWYLYDGYARMVGIHLGIKDGKKQQDESDWIACGLTEALVVLAESGDIEATDVVKNMVEMKFIETGWLLSDNLVQRAEKVSN